jgi:mannose-6-phosphate isomerase-like protein (cupin superfamily)
MTVIIPFGDNCIPASILKDQVNLRSAHLPFDWVFAYPEHIKKALDTDFDGWLDTQYMTLIEDNNNGYSTRHSLYPLKIENDQGGLSGFFEHFDMTNPDNRDKYARAISKFKELIHSDEHIVFFTTIDYNILQEHGLVDYFKRDKIDFLILKHIESDENIAKVEDMGTHTVISQYTPTWQDQWDWIRDIIRDTYKLRPTTLFPFIEGCKNSNLSYGVYRNWHQPTPTWKEFENLYDQVRQSGRIRIKGLDITKEMKFFENAAVEAYPNIDYELFAMEAESFRNLDPANSGTYQHTDPHDVIHWQCRGASEWFMGDNMQSFILEPGDVMWFKAGTKHKIENITEKYALIFNAGLLP